MKPGCRSIAYAACLVALPVAQVQALDALAQGAVMPPHEDLACVVANGGCDAVIGNGSGVIWIRETDPPPPPLSDYVGKTLCVRAGTYNGIWMGNVVAAQDAPLKIVNCGGQVVSKPPMTAPATPISIGSYSRYIVLSGTGSTAHHYGIVAWSIHSEQHMIDISGGASDVKLEYIEARGDPSGGVAAQLTGGTGISYKTYPNCSTGEFTAHNWSLNSVDIQHVYVHDTKREGLYIGPSHFGSIAADGYTPGWNCGGNVVLPEAPVRGAIIRNNILENIGNDAIQLSAAIDGFVVAGNRVRNYGLQGDQSHSAAIQIGSGSQGVVDGNWIESAIPRASTQGLKHSGMGNTWFTNNVVVGAGDGVMLLRNSDVNVGLDLPDLHLYHNTIIGSVATGMVYWCNFNKNIFAANNVFASATGVAHVPGGEQGDSCFEQTMLDDYNGYFADLATPDFVAPDSGDYTPAPTSPLVGAGLDLDGAVATDFHGSPRPDRHDLGAIIADVGIFTDGFEVLPGSRQSKWLQEPAR